MVPGLDATPPELMVEFSAPVMPPRRSSTAGWALSEASTSADGFETFGDNSSPPERTVMLPLAETLLLAAPINMLFAASEPETLRELDRLLPPTETAPLTSTTPATVRCP